MRAASLRDLARLRRAHGPRGSDHGGGPVASGHVGTVGVVSIGAPGHGARVAAAPPGVLRWLERHDAVLTDCDGADDPTCTGSRLVVLCAPAPGHLLPALVRLRTEPRTALLPVVAVLQDVGPSPLVGWRWSEYADVVLDAHASAAQIRAGLERAAAIEAAVDRLPAPSGDAVEARRERILQFMVTRDVETLSPVLAPDDPAGVRYPSLDLLAGATLEGDLDRWTQEGALTREFFDRIHVCPSCSDARLAFREVCSECLASDTHYGSVVHHYRCGHVGPEDRFRRGAALACPSCGEALRHVGIDYERPANLFYCNACGRVAGEGTTMGRCLSCGGSYPVHAVLERTFWIYHLTQRGRLLASDR